MGKLESSFDGGPLGVGISGRDDYGNLRAFTEMEVGNRSVKDFVFAASYFYEVFVVVVGESADDSFALDGANLLVEESAFGG